MTKLIIFISLGLAFSYLNKIEKILLNYDCHLKILTSFLGKYNRITRLLAAYFSWTAWAALWLLYSGLSKSTCPMTLGTNLSDYARRKLSKLSHKELDATKMFNHCSDCTVFIGT